jgi:hypothetical protein
LKIDLHRLRDAARTRSESIPIAYQALSHRDAIAGSARSHAGTPVMPCRAVFDTESPLAKNIREQLSDKNVRERVFGYALWRAGSAWDAKHLASKLSKQ